jgi:hypothetical protein
MFGHRAGYPTQLMRSTQKGKEGEKPLRKINIFLPICWGEGSGGRERKWNFVRGVMRY